MPRSTPTAPATQSPAVVRLIREEIGFDGLLMTDDLSMQALRGGFAERAARALAAGCDVILHCNGDPAEMAAVAEAAPALAGRRLARAEAALALRAPRPRPTRPALEAEFAALDGRWRVPEDFFDAERDRRRGWPPRRWSSTSTASRGRSTCC